MATNGVGWVNATEATKVDNFFEDNTRPNLLSFDFDGTNGNVTFHFDEVVDASSFNPLGVTFQTTKTAGFITFTLEGECLLCKKKITPPKSPITKYK